MPSPLFVLGGPKAKVRPTINNQGNFQIAVADTLAIPPGNCLGRLCRGAAERSQQPDAKAAAAFKPLRSTSLLSHLPNDVRRTIQNDSGEGGFDFGDGLELPDAISELAVSRGHTICCSSARKPACADRSWPITFQLPRRVVCGNCRWRRSPPFSAGICAGVPTGSCCGTDKSSSAHCRNPN